LTKTTGVSGVSATTIPSSPSHAATESTSTYDQRVAIIIGVCVGGGVLLIIAAILIVVLIYEHRRRHHARDIAGQRSGHVRARVRGHYIDSGNNEQVGQRRGSVVTGQQPNYAWTEADGGNIRSEQEQDERVHFSE
jgi:hypothetical protein